MSHDNSKIQTKPSFPTSYYKNKASHLPPFSTNTFHSNRIVKALKAKANYLSNLQYQNPAVETSRFPSNSKSQPTDLRPSFHFSHLVNPKRKFDFPICECKLIKLFVNSKYFFVGLFFHRLIRSELMGFSYDPSAENSLSSFFFVVNFAEASLGF